jgi:KaiC/GvpD/RAD55 family RecA-like ATPase
MILYLLTRGGIETIPYLNILQEVPLFIHFFVIFMSIYHSSMFIMLKKIQKTSPSNVWDNLTTANFLGIILTLVTASLLYKLYTVSNIGHRLLVFAAIFDVATHYSANLGVYYLIKPIIREKINLFGTKYLLFSVFLALFLYFIANIAYNLKYPASANFSILFIFISFSMLLIVYSAYSLLFISESYAKIGFVRKPFLIGGIGMISYLASVGLVVFYIINFLRPEMQKDLYYNISFYVIFFVFTILYFIQFIIDYPSLLQPKWKTLMPFDLPKVAAALTLAFLAASLYFSAKESPNFIIYRNIPYLFVFAFLLPVFLGVMLILTYLKSISARAKLRYWSFLKYGLYTHLTVTLYLFSLLFLSWNNATSTTKLLFALFGVASFAFYIFFALDLRKILEGQNIEPTFDKLDLSRYLVSLYSFFFLLFFGISFTYRETFEVTGDRFELLSYPVILFFIAYFIFAYATYMSVTHKGFEEIMRKNIWTELSYFAAFIAFLLVYFIYSSLSTYLQRFPYHDFFFLGYLLVLIIEIASITTLGLESKYQKTEAKDIVQLLNSHAHHFLRTDYLEDLWEKTLERYVTGNEVPGIRFDSSRRRFDLEKTDEHTRLKIAVGILLGMHKLPNVDRIAIMKRSIEETREEIAEIINEKVLMLPDELRGEFDESVYYPILYEKVVNNLLKHLKAFIPLSEQRKIFDRLKMRDEKFRYISFEKEGIRVKDGTRFSRDDFVNLFRSYFESVEEEFPFKAFLLYEVVREEIKSNLEPYHITAGELLDVAPTGLEDMDEIMAGGLAKRSSTLFIAEEMKTKQRILISFVKQGLLDGNTVIYVNSKRPSQQIMDELLMNFEDLKNFVIIDFYQDIYTEERVSKVVEEEHRIIAPLNKILFQRSIVKRIKSQPRDAQKIVVIDVYDDFSRYYDPEEILELLQNQLDGFKRWNCTSFIAVDPYSYLMRKEGVEEVKKNFDNVLILSGDDKDASVFIEKLYHGTPTKHIIRLHW